MNKLLTVCAVSLAFMQCAAMEKLHEKKAPIFTIENQFSDPVRVIYTLDTHEGAMKEEYLDIWPTEKKSIAQWKNIEKLVVGPYGEWKSLGTREIFGLQPTDYRYELRQIAKQYPDTDLGMVIESGAPKSQALSLLKPALEKILPYKITILPSTTEMVVQRAPETRLLEDAIPRVKQAIAEKKEILPRYVIGVGLDASVDAINREYERSVENWKFLTQSKEPKDVAFGNKLLELFKLAHQTLIADAQYKDFIKKNIIF